MSKALGSVARVGLAITTGGLSEAAYQGFIKPQRDAVKEQKKAQTEATRMAREQADKADQAFNKANGKAPNIAALFAANKGAAAVGSTMLTGPTGVDPNSLRLGRNTLLGA